MSGVGVSGLIANLPTTIEPYPTQDPSFELGGKREAANAAARDAIPANFRTIGMLVTLQDTGVTYELFGGLLNANWQVFTGATFRGEYWVDPAFTGIQLGSSSNPFTTFAAAFAFAAALGITLGLVNFVSTTENITLPAVGNWEIRGLNTTGTATGSVTLTGNVTIANTATARYTLTDFTITGTLTGVCPNALNVRLRLTGVLVNGATSLTAVGSGFWRLLLMGRSPSGDGLGAGGALLVSLALAGQLSAVLYALPPDITFIQDQNHNIDLCDSPAAATWTYQGAAFSNTTVVSTRFATGLTINQTGGGTAAIGLDANSASYLLQAGNGVVKTGTVLVSASAANNSIRSGVPITNNVGVNTLANRSLDNLLVVEAALILLVPGTAGAAVLNVTYTDMTGAVVTRPVTSALNIAGAAGDAAQGSLQFMQNGATRVQYSVTGIVTPGALQYRYMVGCRMAG